MKAICHFVVDRETKGAVRYKQVDAKGKDWDIDDGAEIGSFYIRKSALNGNGIPPKLRVTVES